jgi:uncharacterized protein YukE
VSSGEFPEPPKGSPGGVRGAARAIGKAGAQLESVGQGLRGASGALAADWEGWAAGSYQACVTGLGGPLRVGADQFAECEAAISDYADTLERAQEEIKRLHALWVDAKSREASALSQYNALSMQLASAKPKEVAGIQDSLGDASSAAGSAGTEAAQLVQKAQEELERFEEESERQANVLNGSDPFTSGSLSLGPGAGLFGGAASALSFGVPPNGLGHLNGTITVQHPIRTVAKGPGEWLLGGGPFGGDYKEEEYDRASTNIPGDYGAWWALLNGRHPDALEDDNSLINPVFLATGGVAGIGRGALMNGARALAGGTLLQGERQALKEAYHYTFQRYVNSIEANGLRRGSYVTPDGKLSPMQAQIDLALPPNRGLTDAVIRVDLKGLREEGFKIPEIRQVARSNNMPGGGQEIFFDYEIPARFLKVVEK